MSLNEKLLLLKEDVCIMQKDAKGHGYDYVSEESILLAINDKMIEMGLRLTPTITPGTFGTEVINYKNAKGQDKTDVLVRAEMVYQWKDIETGETEEIDWAMVGQQSDASQAMGSGLTYANRYFLLKFFNISTSNEDPDKIRSQMAAEEERKKLSANQTKIKKLFEKAIFKYQSPTVIYEKLGITKEQFTNDYNDVDRNNVLLEQLELLLKGE